MYTFIPIPAMSLSLYWLCALNWSERGEGGGTERKHVKEGIGKR